MKRFLFAVACLLGFCASPASAAIPATGTGPFQSNAWAYRGADRIGDYRGNPGLFDSTVGGYRGEGLRGGYHDQGRTGRGLFRGRIFRR